MTWTNKATILRSPGESICCSAARESTSKAGLDRRKGPGIFQSSLTAAPSEGRCLMAALSSCACFFGAAITLGISEILAAQRPHSAPDQNWVPKYCGPDKYCTPDKVISWTRGAVPKAC